MGKSVMQAAVGRTKDCPRLMLFLSLLPLVKEGSILLGLSVLLLSRQLPTAQSCTGTQILLAEPVIL